MNRTPFDILAEYEQRSLAHAVVLPEREIAQDQWRGVGYRVGQRHLVSAFANDAVTAARARTDNTAATVTADDLPTDVAGAASEIGDPMGELDALVGLDSIKEEVRLLRADRRQLRLWLTDLRYFAACSRFDGRKPLEPEKLRRFAVA